jgi:transcriptional regulator with XRE-family HTH domain
MFNAKRLGKLRKDLDLTQAEISEKLSISQSSYCKYEKNKADLNLDLLKRLKEVFGVDPNEFILTHVNPVKFKNFGTLKSKGVVQSENYYQFLKEISNIIITNQKNIIDMINHFITQIQKAK